MTTILIVEGNTPDLLVAGRSYSACFVRSFQGLAAELNLRVVTPYSAALSADVFQDVDGVVFTGSSVDWPTDAPQAAPLRTEMTRAFDTGLPVWGSCNGLQLAAVILGGSVGASPNGVEIGLARDMRVTDAGLRHPMMAGRMDRFAAPCVHRDEVQSLPDGAVLLAGNAHSRVQAMAYQSSSVDFWGTQYHPELTAPDIGAIVSRQTMAGHDISFGADLNAAETDADAAVRVGSTPAELSLSTRARELLNWIVHVQTRRSAD